MKAPSDDNKEDSGGAEPLDYCEIFSVLKFYFHMSKKEIYGSSIPYLLGLYKTYGKRACENLGVSPDRNDNGEEASKTELSESDYPVEFQKLASRRRDKPIDDGYDSEEDFLKDFSSFDSKKFKNLHFAE